MTNGIDVFISYKREERALSEKVKSALIDAGYTAVTDLNISKNDEFGDAIDTMIRTATLTLVLWTRASAASDWVRKEARLARDLEAAGKPNRYLGVMVEDVDLDLPPDLRGLQMVDIHQDGINESGLADLLAASEEILGAEKQKDSEAAQASSEALAEEWQLYDLARSINVAESYRRYLTRYPDGEFADDAERQLRMFIWYLHPFRRGNLAHTVAALGIVATVAVTLWATTRDPVVIGVDPSKHRSTTAALEKAEEKIDVLETELEQAVATMRSTPEEIEILERQSREAVAKVQALELERTNLLSDRNLLSDDLEAAKDQVEILERRSQDAFRNIQSLEEESSNLVDERAKLSNDLETTQMEVETVQRQLRDALANVRFLEGERSKLSGELTRLSGELQVLRAEVLGRPARSEISALSVSNTLYSPRRNNSIVRESGELVARCSFATAGEWCIPASEPSSGRKVCSAKYFGETCLNVSQPAGNSIPERRLPLIGVSSVARCSYVTLGEKCVSASNPFNGVTVCSEEILGHQCRK